MSVPSTKKTNINETLDLLNASMGVILLLFGWLLWVIGLLLVEVVVVNKDGSAVMLVKFSGKLVLIVDWLKEAIPTKLF